jgi:hypothetical protein
MYAVNAVTDPPLVSLQDQFDEEPVAADPLPATAFWVPATKDAEHPEDLLVHELCYPITGLDVVSQVTILNQFGEETFPIEEPQLLCVPTQKSLIWPPDPEIPLARDHFKCYEAFGEVAPGLHTISDQFNLVPRDVTLGPAVLFCAPVDKNGEGIDKPEEHVTCYPALFDRQEEPPIVVVRNQFVELPEGWEDLFFQEFEEGVAVCVPSFKLDWVPEGGP